MAKEEETIRTDKPKPLNKPVVSRSILLLVRHFHSCVYPSIRSGIWLNKPIQNGICQLESSKSGTNKYPDKMPVHLAQSGIALPFMCRQRSGFRWHGTSLSKDINCNPPRSTLNRHYHSPQNQETHNQAYNLCNSALFVCNNRYQ